MSDLCIVNFGYFYNSAWLQIVRFWFLFLLTWQRRSSCQVWEPSSCTVSGGRSCFSIPGGTSPSQGTHSPQTSSIVWQSLQCLCPSSWTPPCWPLPKKTGKGYQIYGIFIRFYKTRLQDSSSLAFEILLIFKSVITLIPPQLLLLMKSTGLVTLGTAGKRSRKSSSTGLMSFAAIRIWKVSIWRNQSKNSKNVNFDTTYHEMARKISTLTNHSPGMSSEKWRWSCLFQTSLLLCM